MQYKCAGGVNKVRWGRFLVYHKATGTVVRSMVIGEFKHV